MASLLLLAALLLPQGPGGNVSASATVEPTTGPAGSEVQVQLTLDIQPGWHVYHPDQNPDLGIPVSASLIGENFTETGEMKALSPGRPHIEKIGSQTLVYKWMEGKAKFSIPAKVSGDNGTVSGKVKVQWQVCNDRVCLPPEEVEVPFTYVIDSSAAAPTGAGAAAADPEVDAAPRDGPEATLTEGPGEKVTVQGKKVVAELGFTRAQIPAGGQAVLGMETVVDFGWHLYAPEMDPEVPGVPVTVEVVTEGFEAGKLRTTSKSKPHTEDFGGGMVFEYLWIEGKGTFELPITANVEPGKYEVELKLNYQVCDDSVCLDSDVYTAKVPVEVVDPSLLAGTIEERGTTDQGGGEAEGNAIGNAINKDAFKVLQDEGFWALMIAAIAAGFATLLTPCVFPMIPITVSFFTKRAEAGKGTAIGNASAYAFGIILTFVGLGLGAGAILGATGANQIASNPWLNLAIAALFIVLGLSLLGFYEIQPPKFLQKFASEAQAEGGQKGGYMPVIIMAFAFSVTAFTCTVGFVGGLIALSATAGAWWYSLAAMTVYAVVFAIPFFFLALFPNMLQKMPTAGGWMNAVKVSFGYIEIIAAWKFLTSAERVWDLEILTRPVVIILTVIPLLLWAGYMFGLYTTKGDYGQKPPRTMPRMAVGLFALVSAVYIASAYPRDNYKGWVEAYFPPSDYGNPYGPLGLEWHESYEAAFAEGRDKNQVVFLDFTGVTCVNCLRMEGNIFPADGVADRIESMVRAHLYVDKGEFGPANGEFQELKFQRVSQPFYVVMDPFTQEPLSQFDGYDPDPELFANFLRDGIEAGKKLGIGVDDTAATPIGADG